MSQSKTSRKELVAPFNSHTHVEVLDPEAGKGRTRIADLPELTNHIGTVHAGALFTVGEAASGMTFMDALYEAFGEKLAQLVPVVKTASIKFLKIAKGEINATGTLMTPAQDIVNAIEQSGRTTANVEVALADAEGTVVATMAVEWYVRRAPTS